MTTLEMLNDVAARLGDPLMTKNLLSPLKRWIRIANNKVQNDLFPVFPEFFTKLSSTLVPSSQIVTLPTDYLFATRVLVDGKGARKLTAEEVSAVGAMSFFPATSATDALYYVYERKMKVWPTTAAGVVLEYCQKAPQINCDFGTGAVTAQNGVRILTDTTKAWVDDYWNTVGKIIIKDVSYTITDGTATTIEFTAGIGAATYEYELDFPTLIPADFHYLIVLEATAIALRQTGKVAEAESTERHYAESLAVVVGVSK